MDEEQKAQMRQLFEDVVEAHLCPPCEEQWLTSQQFCKRYLISEPTLRAMRRDGNVKFKQLGRQFRYWG